MGAVYEVEQLATHARRALKVLHVQFAGDERLRARFVQEARVAATLRSDHIAKVIDAGGDEGLGTLYLVMELLEGETLSQLLKKSGPLPPGQVAEILRQMCHALGSAHE